MRKRPAWSVVGAVVLLAVATGIGFFTQIDQRGDEDEPFARADCRELAGGADVDLDWRLGLVPGWLCSWKSVDGREGGSAFITWNTYR